MIRTYKSQGSPLGIAELLQGIETIRDGVESFPSSLHKLTHEILALTPGPQMHHPNMSLQLQFRKRS